jgi:AcrR family transcriptional regulator
VPKVVDHDEYRKELVESCIELFAKEGYQALTMRKIATALGVSTGTLYHYFPNKEALFLGVVGEVARQDLETAAQAIPLDIPDEMLPQLILQFIQEKEHWFLQQHLVFCEYLRGKKPREVRSDPALRQAAEVYHGSVARLLDIQPDQAKTLLYFLKGLMIQRFFDGGLTTFESQEPYIRALLMHMREAA